MGEKVDNRREIVSGGQKIIVTRGFNKQDVIGYLQLLDGVEIPPDASFEIGFIVLEEKYGFPTKICVQEISLVVEPAISKRWDDNG